jgi:colanic acid/amylovoran biosynthesis glycosyltransferase
MAIGRPAISTYVAGIPELVRDGVDGWLVPAGDVEALADAMHACLDTPPDRLEAMGRSAHERVQARHAIDVEAGRLRTMFEAAIAERTA